MEGEGDEDSIHAESEEEGDFFAEFEQESGWVTCSQRRRNGIISESDEVSNDDEMDVQLSRMFPVQPEKQIVSGDISMANTL